MTTNIQQTMIRNGLILALFAIVTTGLIALTYFGTKDQIARQQQQKLLSILNAVIDKNSYDNAIHLDCALFTSNQLLGSDTPQHIYRASKAGKSVAAAIETTATDGYNGKIHLVVGLTKTPENTVVISGVRVLEHKETPGLGDKIDLRINDWVLDFNQQVYHQDNESIWAVKKDGGQFDQFTGATITPRAVVKAVKHSAEYYLANQAAIFEADNACSNSAVINASVVQEVEASE
ncbi:electron transport complex subunit RsxG [uncultured Paraglaciecola sp.]|uniref:electron transport complex subunit RsxG n=1 Tax=uncultured Paraglaciecola sp. TaxID=1765024 RepID=UPI00262D461E|nr:electron transport complex subunit RsxG [uncultured Paraglaciecola sp.]